MEENLSHANRLPKPCFVMKDASVSLAGCCQTHTAAAHCGSLHHHHHHPEPPPPLDYSSAAPSPRRSVSCPRSAHHGARTQSAQASHKQRRAEPTDKSCQKHTALQSDLHLPAGQQACGIYQSHFRCQMFACEFVLVTLVHRRVDI